LRRDHFQRSLANYGDREYGSYGYGEPVRGTPNPLDLLSEAAQVGGHSTRGYQYHAHAYDDPPPRPIIRESVTIHDHDQQHPMGGDRQHS
jgi:hypothetical protein